LHLQFLYRDLFTTKGIYNRFSGKLNVLEATIVTILLIVVMMIIAKFWGNLKTKNPLLARRITIAIISVGFLIFITR
jgi:uncharacterized membrane protein